MQVRFFIVKKRQSGGEKKATHLFTTGSITASERPGGFPLANKRRK